MIMIVAKTLSLSLLNIFSGWQQRC